MPSVLACLCRTHCHLAIRHACFALMSPKEQHKFHIPVTQGTTQVSTHVTEQTTEVPCSCHPRNNISFTHMSLNKQHKFHTHVIQGTTQVSHSCHPRNNTGFTHVIQGTTRFTLMTSTEQHMFHTHVTQGTTQVSYSCHPRNKIKEVMDNHQVSCDIWQCLLPRCFSPSLTQ